LRGLDLNQRPLGYEPNELPGCSTPHSYLSKRGNGGQSPDAVQMRCGTFKISSFS
jgi:hypothetical protein